MTKLSLAEGILCLHTTVTNCTRNKFYKLAHLPEHIRRVQPNSIISNSANYTIHQGYLAVFHDYLFDVHSNTLPMLWYITEIFPWRRSRLIYEYV